MTMPVSRRPHRDHPTTRMAPERPCAVPGLPRLRRERGLTLVMVTHDMNVAARAGRIVRMLDGRIVDEEPGKGGSASPEMPGALRG